MVECPFCGKELEVALTLEETVRLCACRGCLSPFSVQWVEGKLCAAPLDGVTDLRVQAPQGSVMGSILSTLNGALEDLPVLPEIPQRILAMVNDPLSSIADIANEANQDAAVSVKILKVSNSAYYGGLHEIKDMGTACTRLGMKTITNIVLTIAHSNLYRVGDRRYVNVMQQLWRHSVATAHCAEHLASFVGGAPPTTAFLAGLVHEIGKVVLLNMITVRYKGAAGRLRESTELLARVLNRFDSLVGLHVVQRWDLSPEFRVTTFCRDRPDCNPAPEWSRLTHLVALACALANAKGFGWTEKEAALPLEHPSLQVLGIPGEKLTEVFDKSLQERLEALMGALA